MSELPRLLSNEKINLKSINFSRNNKLPSKENNNFNNNLIKSHINTYNNNNNSNLEKIKYKNALLKTESNKKSSIYLDKTDFTKNKSFAKLNFNEVLNFNFGSQNPAQLKVINTSVLTMNSPEININNKKENNKTSIKKSPLFNKSTNSKFNKTKYLIGYPISNKKEKNIKKNNSKGKFISLFSEGKYFKNKNGILRLPRLSSVPKNQKIKKNIYLYDSGDKNMTMMKKSIEEKDFNKLKKLIELDNDLMNQQISARLKRLEETKEKYKLERPNEDTEEGLEKLFEKYNTKRAKEKNIKTNLSLKKKEDNNSLINIGTKEKSDFYMKYRFNNILMDTKGNPRLLLKLEEEKNRPEKITDFEIATLANRANRKVEKCFPDLCAFNLPKVLRQNKEYNLKLLYDVFIEFKSLLKCGMVHNKNLNLDKQGIDFDTFFNCNTKINQQGIALSKKIFKAFNNKTNINYMSWQNYFEGMMKIKDQNIDNKLDLFFQILDENGDGSFDYNEVYNLSLISLQRVIPPDKNYGKLEDDKENITHILAEFLTKFVFELCGIETDSDIPIDLLRAKMDEKNEQSDYLEFFLCADNFA
jgi:hypothetical protein